MPKISRNAPCPCGSGKKYKKCCLDQDQKAESEQLKVRQEEAREEQEKFVQYAEALDELSNRANDLIRSEQWTEAEACCCELLDRFPEEIDGHHRSYECYKAKGDFGRARTHAMAALDIVERSGGFDPEFPSMLREDIAAFEKYIRAGEGRSGD